jgi:hypothetical protein
MFKTKRSNFVFILFNSLLLVNCANLHGNLNENAALRSIDTIRVLQAQYASKHMGQYASTFDDLIKTTKLNEDFAGEKPVVKGYIFEMKTKSPSTEQSAFYSITARPKVSEGIQATGTRSFYYDSTLGTIKYTEENRHAKKDDPSI